MFSIKAWAIAMAVSAGVVLAVPVTSQAMTSSVKINTGVSVNNKHKSTSWWARHCAISNDVKCRHRYTRSYRHHHYYGYYRRHHRLGVTVY